MDYLELSLVLLVGGSRSKVQVLESGREGESRRRRCLRLLQTY
jgi:hypothetical protein